MTKRIISTVVLILLFMNAMNIGVIKFAAQGTGVGQGSTDWWSMFRHYANHTGYTTSAVPTPISEPMISPMSMGRINSSLAVVNNTVYVCSLDGYVRALDMYDLSLKCAPRDLENNITSPAVFGGVVCVGSENGLVYLLDAAELATIGLLRTEKGPVRSSPVIDENGVLYVGSSDGYLYAFDIETQIEEWRFWTNSSIESSPALSGDSVIFGTVDGRIYALEKSGRIQWFKVIGEPIVSSPAIADGRVFFGCNDSRVYALNIADGSPSWTPFTTGGSVTSSPAVANGRVFISSEDSHIYALNATTGAKIWDNATAGPVHSSPAVSSDGKVFVCSGVNINAFDEETGYSIADTPFPYNIGGPADSSPAIAGSTVFIGSYDGYVYSFGYNESPIARFTVNPDPPIVTEKVRFDGSDSTNNDNFTGDYITKWEWNFGNGTAEGPVVYRTFYESGTYNVTLTVTDKRGSSNSTWRLVNVSEAWPMFRHDPLHLGYSTHPAPVKNDLLFDPLKIWQYPTPEQWIFPSPAVVGDILFMSSPNGSVYAYNITERLLKWNQTLPGPYDIHSSIAYDGAFLYVGSRDGHLYALDTVTGIPQWDCTLDPMKPIYSSPTVVGNMIFVGCQDNKLFAIDKQSHSKVGNSPDLGGIIDSSPAVASGRVFVGSYNGSIYALEEANLTNVIWNFRTDGPVVSSPAVTDGRVYVGSRDGKLYCLNATTNNKAGEKLWEFDSGNPIDSSPAVAGGFVFFGSNGGKLFALNATTENIPASEREIWNVSIGPVGYSSPAVADGKVYIGSKNGKIYALSIAEKGREVWSYQTGGSVESSPAILNDALFVGSQDGYLYAFSNQTHDIAVSNVVVSPAPDIPQGSTANINVTVRNEGTFNETNINVTAYYDSIAIGSSLINLIRAEPPATVEFAWNTSDVSEGIYTISANATLTNVTDDDPSDNNLVYGNVTIVSTAHDVAIINVTTSKSGCLDQDNQSRPIVCQGYDANVSVAVENQGNYPETFNVTVYANTTTSHYVVGIQEVTLNPGNNTTLTFVWNTTGWSKDNYTINAVADRVLYEADTSDNEFTNDTIEVVHPGDVYHDPEGYVGIDDIFAVASHFGHELGKLSWDPHDPNYDITNDGYIGIDEIFIVASHFGQEDP